jgi:hypothetical protein
VSPLARIPELLKPGDPVDENWRAINELIEWAKAMETDRQVLEVRVDRIDRKPDWGEGGGENVWG